MSSLTSFMRLAAASLVFSIGMSMSAVNAQPAKQAAPNFAAKPAALVKQDDGTQNKLAGSHSCWCEITCKSNQSNATSVSTPVSIGPGFSGPITPAKHDQCSQRCLGQLQDTAASVADAGKLCLTGTCSGRSWIGTGIGGDRPTIENVDFDNSKEDFCKTPGVAGACCPPMASADVDLLFTRTINGPASAPYGLLYTPNFVFDAKMKAAAQLALLSGGCSTYQVVYTLRNMTNNTVQGTAAVTYTGNTVNGPVLTPGFGSNLSINTDYQLTGAVGCASRSGPYYSDACKAKGFNVKWSFSQVGRMANQPANAPEVTVEVKPLN